MLIVRSVWPTDAISRHRTGSTLSQVKTWCVRHQVFTWTNADKPSVVLAFTWWQYHRKCSKYVCLISVGKLLSKDTATHTRGQWVNRLFSLMQWQSRPFQTKSSVLTHLEQELLYEYSIETDREVGRQRQMQKQRQTGGNRESALCCFYHIFSLHVLIKKKILQWHYMGGGRRIYMNLSTNVMWTDCCMYLMLYQYRI